MLICVYVQAACLKDLMTHHFLGYYRPVIALIQGVTCNVMIFAAIFGTSEKEENGKWLVKMGVKWNEV